MRLSFLVDYVRLPYENANVRLPNLNSSENAFVCANCIAQNIHKTNKNHYWTTESQNNWKNVSIYLNMWHFKHYLRVFAFMDTICIEVFSETMQTWKVTNTPIERENNAFFFALCHLNELSRITKISIRNLPWLTINRAKILLAFAFVVTWLFLLILCVYHMLLTSKHELSLT